MRERHAFARNEAEQRVRHVATRVDLLDAEHRRHVRKAPGVNVEHRRDRHVDVARGERRVRRVRRRGDRRERMQHELPMTVVHALRQAGRAGRVERRGARVLGKGREREARRRFREHRFVLAGEFELRLRRRGAVVDQHESHTGTDPLANALEQRQEFGVDQDHVVLRVIDRVQDLVRRDPHVDRVQHRAHHRDGEEALEIAMAVPVHHRDRRARLDAQRAQRRCETAHALVERLVRVAARFAVDDLLRGCQRNAAGEHAADRQRRVVRRLRAGNRGCSHEVLLERFVVRVSAKRRLGARCAR